MCLFVVAASNRTDIDGAPVDRLATEPLTPEPHGYPGLLDPSVDAQLFPLSQVRQAAWHVSRLVMLLIALALTGAGTAAFGLRYLAPESSPEYESVAAGGLLALAGIVPAVLAAVASGRPVTRLDGGRLMLRGSAGWVVLVYCLAWTAALALPLLALVEAWAWLVSPTGIGVGLGLLVLSTLGTPIVFLVLAARLNPRNSSLLAVDRAIRSGAARTADVRARCDLVKDLRDLATTEHKTGDRRAVRYRMAGLATIAAHAPGSEVRHLALDELGLVCQAVARDRDLAREGIALLRRAAEAVPPTAVDLLDRVIEEAADVWATAARDGASPRVCEDAARTAIAVSLLGGDVPRPALAGLVREMGTATERAAARAVEQIGLVDHGPRSIDVVHLPSSHPLVPAWVDARSRLGNDGFLPLVRRIAAWTNDAGDTPRSIRPVIAAAATIVQSHTVGLSLVDSLRSDVKKLVQEGCTAALTRVAVAARDSEHDLADPGHGVLFAELLRNWSAMSSAELDAMVTTFSATTTDVLLDRCAPSLLPRLDTLVNPSLGRKWERKEVDFPEHLQIATARLLNRLRTAAVTRDPSLSTSPVLLEPVFARLMDAAMAGALTPETQLVIRKITAGSVQALEDQGAHDVAAVLAAPAIPVLVSSEGDYGPAWLLWWQRQAGGTLPQRPSPVWCAGLAVALVSLRIRCAPQDPGTPLDLPASSVVAGRDWTHGEASDAAADALLTLQAGLPAVALGLVFTEIRRWLTVDASEGPAARAEGAVRLGAALQLLPAFPEDDPRTAQVHRHRVALELWRDWVITRDPAEDVRSRAGRAGDVLRSPAMGELRGRDDMTAQVLSALALAWCEGGGGPGRVDPDEAAAVVSALRTHWVVRATVAAVLRKAMPSVRVSGVLLDDFADDLRTLARQLEMAVAARVGEQIDRAHRMLRWGLEHPDLARRQDRHLPTVARCLTRAIALAGERRDGRTRDELERTVALLRAWGEDPEALPGATEARTLLTGGGTGEDRGGTDRPAAPRPPAPRTSDEWTAPVRKTAPGEE